MTTASARGRAEVAVLTVLAPVLLAAVPISAQERVEVRRPLGPGAYVKIWNGGGTVRVEGWERDSLVVTGTRTSPTGRFFQGVADSLAKVGFYADTSRGEAVEGDLRVRLPATSTVWVKVAGASVTVAGVRGSVDVFSVSGSVEVRGSPRTVYVESMAGRVDLDVGRTEVVRVKGGGGGVGIRGRVLDLTASTVDGAIEVRGLAARRAELESVEGGITYRGGLVRGGRLSAESHAGDVELTLPRDVDAAFDLASVEGRIDNELVDRGSGGSSSPGSRQIFETGAGEAEVEVRTFSGAIRLDTGVVDAGEEGRRAGVPRPPPELAPPTRGSDL